MSKITVQQLQNWDIQHHWNDLLGYEVWIAMQNKVKLCAQSREELLTKILEKTNAHGLQRITK